MGVKKLFPIIKEKISQNIPSVIIGIGIILRLAQYLYNRSLTEGEAALAINIVRRSYAELLKPLDFTQAAPVGFLMLQKFFVDTLGNNEFALRLFPLIAGIISLILFFEVVKKSISSKAIPIALILFAVGDYLIYFASEIKQYSSDVTITLLLILIAICTLRKNFSIKYILLFGLVGAISFWFSHPAVFTFYAAGIVILINLVRRRQWRNFAWLIFAGVIVTASLGINYFVSLQALSKSEDLLGVWQQGFMPFPPTSPADIQWFGYSFLRLFKNPLGLSIYELLLAALSFLVGTIVLFINKRKIVLILLLPILLALIASGLHKYPFQGRLLLFITPLMFAIIGEGIDFVRNSAAQGSNIISIALVWVLLIHPVFLAGYHLIRPRAPEESRPVMHYLYEHKEKGDSIYVYYAAVNAFRYYSDRFGLTADEYITGVEARQDWTNYYKDLKKLKGTGRVWIVFSHVATWGGVDEERLFLSYLNILGTQLDAFRASGASVYLYDLSNSP